MLRLARSGALAHLPALAGTFLVLALAGTLLSGTGVLIESGLRAGGDSGGLVVALASSFSGTAMLLVVFVVSATVSLALRQRQSDFALLRAVGATRSQVRRLVGHEVVLITLVAVPLGAVPGVLGVRLITPMLVDGQVVEPGFQMAATPVPGLTAILLLLPVAYLAARLATRETLRTPPTTAVRQSAVEPDGIGRARRLAAVVVAAAGLVMAFSPLFVPGTIGSAVAAVSAFLLVGAAALGGPLLVAWVLGATGRLRGGPATRLALANTRGFSRRLTTAVVPLALVLSVGTLQSTVGDTVSAAATQELEDGLRADLIVTQKVDAERLAEVAALPGIETVTPLGSVAAKVRVDDEEVPGLSALSWESVQTSALPAGGTGGTLDPDVVEGDLAGLDRADTVAISRDTRLETGKGVGEKITVRWGGGAPTEATVVAVYDRGLGFGPYLTGRGTPAAHDVEVSADTVLLRTSGPGAPAAVAELGLTAVDKQQYVASATASDQGSQDLSLTLLLALLLFVGIAAANALVLTTAGRRAELALLRRTGATRRQLVVMAAVESVVAGLAAWAIGTISVLPGVLGVSFGLLGAAVPPVDLAAYAVLTGVVLTIPLFTVVPVVARSLRR